jgi:hypothetical protein
MHRATEIPGENRRNILAKRRKKRERWKSSLNV